MLRVFRIPDSKSNPCATPCTRLQGCSQHTKPIQAILKTEAHVSNHLPSFPKAKQTYLIITALNLPLTSSAAPTTWPETSTAATREGEEGISSRYTAGPGDCQHQGSTAQLPAQSMGEPSRTAQGSLTDGQGTDPYLIRSNLAAPTISISTLQYSFWEEKYMLAHHPLPGCCQ